MNRTEDMMGYVILILVLVVGVGSGWMAGKL